MKQKHRILQRVAGVALALLMMLLWGPGAVWAQAGRDIGLPLQSAQYDTAAGDVQVDPPVESPAESPAPPTESSVASPVVSPTETPVETPVVSLESPAETPVESPEGTVVNAAGMKFGCTNPASLGDYVWNDADRDGIQDSGESGVYNIEVKLYQGSTYIGHDYTDHSGKYLFTDLAAGAYKVKFPDRSGYAFTHQDAGSDDAKDSDAGSDGYTASVTLSAGQNVTTVDCGYVCKSECKIGDYLWYDVNGNGIQDSGEFGIPGVTVQLYQGGSAIASDTTNGSGKYEFDGLDAGTYQVKFPTVSGKVFTVKDAGSDDGKDSDAGTNGMTGDITLFWGDCNMTVDCGYRVPAQLGDFVWLDANENGIQDAGEVGIGGVSVELYSGSTKVATTITAANGSYLFTGLDAGAYKVKFPTLTNKAFTTANVGSNDAKDSDADATGYSPSVTLAWGDCNTTVDCGYVDRTPAALGDFVWYDVNGNGVQDSTDGIFGGVLVELYKDGGKIAETTSNGSGLYRFENLAAGTYQVKFADKTASGYGFTSPNTGSDDALDSDAAATGFTANVTLAWGQTDLTVDCGYVALPKASLGDLVWYDVNGNGVQDATDGIFGGVTVELYQGGGLKATTTSDASGLYHFANLEAGTYQVKFADNTASGYGFTTPNAGGDDALDSDATATGYTTDVTLAWGENNTTVDCGYVALPKASLGDFVWEDTNYNGYQDAGEPGIGGLTVELYQGTVLKASTTTDASGLYHFTGLDAGGYIVKFYAASGMFLSSADLGDDAHDSDAGVDGRTPVVNLTWGENNTTVDCGMAAPGTVGDYVWLDTNKNGVQDAGEPAVPGVPVDLYKDGAVVSSTATNSSGLYEFTGLLPGTYHVQLTLPPNGTLGYTGFAFTTQCVAGGTEANDSNPDATGLCASFFLHSAEHVTTFDAGLVADWGSIGDFTWVDTDKDGLQDVVESGLGGVTVNLFSVNGAVLTLKSSTVTDSVGHYLFTLLPFGQYRVQFVKPAGYDQTLLEAGAEIMDSDAGLDGYTADVVLNSDHRNDLNQDAGYVRSTCSLGDRVWLDANWNGVQDAGEPGVNGITVELYKDGVAAPIATTVTAAHNGQDGWYLFEGLDNGSYRIKVAVNAAQYILTAANTGADDVDSDADVSGYSTWVALNIDTNRNDTTVDAGLEIPCSIGDYVWLDKPKTGLPGVQESDEPGHNGVKVELYRQVNGVMQLVASTVTATHNGKDGWYTFSGLQEGVYQVKFIILEDGYELVAAHAGSDDSKDSDAGALGLTPYITLSVSGNRNDTTIDGGVRIPSTGGLPAGIFYGAGGTLLLAGIGLSLPFFLRQRQKMAMALRLLRLRLTALLVRK